MNSNPMNDRRQRRRPMPTEQDPGKEEQATPARPVHIRRVGEAEQVREEGKATAPTDQPTQPRRSEKSPQRAAQMRYAGTQTRAESNGAEGKAPAPISRRSAQRVEPKEEKKQSSKLGSISISGNVKVVLLCVGSAIALLLVTLLIVSALGFRYMKREVQVPNNDGIMSTQVVKYFGKVNKNNEPIDGTIYFPDGTKAKVDGDTGSVTYGTGEVYEGTLVNLMRQGKGKLTYPNGDVYEGEFANDQLTGKGVFEFASGDRYEGHLVNGKMHGIGVYTWADGSTYEGGFENGAKTGVGKMTQADGAVYEGNYYKDLKTGEGKYTWANGDTYEGNFFQDVRTGQGKYTWANGDCYEGEFANNLVNGWGKYTWANGRTYVGLFENGKIVNTVTGNEIEDTQ